MPEQSSEVHAVHDRGIIDADDGVELPYGETTMCVLPEEIAAYAL